MLWFWIMLMLTMVAGLVVRNPQFVRVLALDKSREMDDDNVSESGMRRMRRRNCDRGNSDVLW